MVASHMAPNGDLDRNPDMCPDWESNQRYFGSQACTQSTELCQPGVYFKMELPQLKNAMSEMIDLFE